MPDLVRSCGRARPKPRYPSKPVGLGEHTLAAGGHACQPVVWRQGSRGALASVFLARRVRPARRPATARLAADGSLPKGWLLAEWPRGPRAHRLLAVHLARRHHPTDLVRLTKIRWRIEHDYRELKTGRGLDHFEGRT